MTDIARTRFEPFLTIPVSVPSTDFSPGPQGLSKAEIHHDLSMFAKAAKHTRVRTPAQAEPKEPSSPRASDSASRKRPRIEDVTTSSPPATKRKPSPEKSSTPHQQPVWAAELFASKSLTEGKKILRKAGYRRADDDTSRPADLKLRTALVSAITTDQRDAVGAIW